jgi:hypothetical protein
MAVRTDPAAISGLVSGLTFVGGVAGALSTSDAPYPRPGSDVAAIRRYFRDNRPSARLGALGQLVSALTLARFVPSVIRLAGRSDRRARALQGAALAGGAVAVASLATSAAYAAALSTNRADDDEWAAATHRRAFLAGGVTHGAGFGLLVGALALASERTGVLPAPAARAALGSAAAGLLAPLYLVAEPAAWLIPIGRFSGLVVTGFGGVRMARAKH